MIKTVLVPQATTLQISIPDNYVGKEIELLLYARDELAVNTEEKKTMSSFLGLLTEKEAEDLQSHVSKSRDEWETGF